MQIPAKAVELVGVAYLNGWTVSMDVTGVVVRLELTDGTPDRVIHAIWSYGRWERGSLIWPRKNTARSMRNAGDIRRVLSEEV